MVKSITEIFMTDLDKLLRKQCVKVELTGEIEPQTFDSIKEANEFLTKIALKERTGAYCKIWFKLTFEDGREYQSSRMDINWFAWQRSNDFIKTHIEDYVRYYSNSKINHFLDKEIRDFENFLENYEVSQYCFYLYH